MEDTVYLHICAVCVCSVAQSCPTLCNPMDCSSPGSSFYGISQARILEWITISYSRGSSWPRDQTRISCVSCIGRRILYHWATWQAPITTYCSCCWVTSVVSDSVRPHRRQPTRMLRPWDSPGKNTGVGCHFLLQCMKVKSEVAQSCPTLSDPMDCSLPGSSIHGIFQARVLE